MPKITKEMPAVEVKNIKKPGRYAVGGVSGLLLEVKKSGARSWILRTTIGKKRRSIGLGGYPTVTLAQARDKAREAMEMIYRGVDPIEEKQARKRSMMEARAKKMTFAEAAQKCHETKQPEFQSEKHSRDWISAINRYAIPVIGNIPVDEVELHHLLKILEPIWQKKTETATRVRQRIEAILSWATVAGYRKGENPARWKGHLDVVLPKPSKVRKIEHFQALPWQKIGEFMSDLRRREGVAARALEFIILTAVRSNEARYAVWEEIDFANRTWTIPAERMKKTGREHSVPLSEDAVSLLKNLPRLEGSPYVFPAARGGHLSDMAISMVCRRMKVDAVPHGFRSTFRDWCSENTNFPNEVAEMALAHTIQNKVEAAYRRGDLFEKRRKLMEAWAAFCNQVRTESTSNVKSIRKVKG